MVTIRRFIEKLSHRFNWIVPLCIVAAAFIIRLMYLNQVSDIPTFDHPIMDEHYHVQLVEQILNNTLPQEPFFRAPLYPYTLALLFTLTGKSFYWSRFIQIIIASLLPLLIYGIGLRLFNRSIAFWSAVTAVFYPTFLYYDTSLLITSLMTVLTTLLLLLLYRCQDNPTRTVNFIMAGLLLGVAGLARPNILLFGPALFIWIWLVIKPHIGFKPAIIRFALIGFSTLFVILPTTLRNYVVSHDPVFIAWQGGFNFFLGNNRQASGWSATAPGIDQTWQGGYLQAIAIAEQAAGHRLKRSEISDFWYDKAWEEIAADPGHFVALQLRKLRLFLNGYEIPNNQDIYLVRQFAPIIKPLLFTGVVYFPFGILIPLAVLGLVLSLRKWRFYLLLYLLLGSYIISLQLFFVCARYRQPLIPVLILLAVFAIVRLIRYFRQRNYRTASVCLLLIGLVMVESNHDMLLLDPARIKAENHLLLGNAYLEQGQTVRAEKEFRKAITVDTTFAQGYNNLGMLLAKRKSYFEAISLFQKAISIDPETVESFFNLATVYLEKQDINSALEVLKQARRFHPYNDYVYLKLGLTYYEVGKIADAKEAIQQCLRLNPDNNVAREVYQQIITAEQDSLSTQ